jgi:hypothetical protein
VDEAPEIIVVSTEGSFTQEGNVSSVSTDLLSLATPEGEFRVSLSGARVIKESGELADQAYLHRGIRVSVKGKDGIAEEIKVVSSPDIMAFSPAKDAPVGLIFKIEGSSKLDNGDVFVTIKNRRTGSVYFDGSSSVSGSSRYGDFSFSVNLSSALDISDGDMLDVELFNESESNVRTGGISTTFRYAGGLSSKIKVYFVRNGQCGSVVSVDRLIDASKSAVRSGIEEMIKGPSSAEKEAGFATAISSSVKIRSLELKDGAVHVDFNAEILKNGGICGAATIRRQIIEMVTQFPGITEVVILSDGEEISL